MFGPLQPVFDGGIAGRSIGHCVGKEHRQESFRARREVAAQEFLGVGDTAEAAADNDADPGRVDGGRYQAGVVQRHARGNDGELAAAVELARLEGRHELGRPEAVGFAPQVARLAEDLLRNRLQPALACQQRLPEPLLSPRLQKRWLPGR